MGFHIVAVDNMQPQLIHTFSHLSALDIHLVYQRVAFLNMKPLTV
jgi:hypothetical protein